MAEGFEPSDGGYPSHAFEACSLGRSDTPPRGAYRAAACSSQSLAAAKNSSSGAAHSSASTPRAPPADASAAGRAPRPTASRPRRSSAPTPRTPAAQPAPSPARPRTSCTARPSPRASCPPAASRRRAPARRPQRQDLGVRGRIAQLLRGRWPPAPARCRRRRTTTAPIGTSRGPGRPAAFSAARIRSLVGRGHRSRRSSTADNSSANPISLRDPAQLLVGVEVGLVEDDAQHRLGQPDVGQHPEVALLERVGAVEIVVVDVGVELLEHLGGDVVVQRRGGIGQQQPRPGGAGRTITKNSSSMSSSPKTAPALRNSRSSVSAAVKLVRAAPRIAVQRHCRPPGRRPRRSRPAGPLPAPSPVHAVLP